MQSFRQIFAAVPSEQFFESAQAQLLEQSDEPRLLDSDQLAYVSGGVKQDIPGGGW